MTHGSAQDIGGRNQQQDSFGFSDFANADFIRHAGRLAVVADGMGGMAHGDIASRTAIEQFLQGFAAKTEAEALPDTLVRCLETANAAVFRQALALSAAEEMGTTLIATVVRDSELHWIATGDSAIFLFRGGELTLINMPHVFAAMLDEKAAMGEISREVANLHPEREALTYFVGMERMPALDRSVRPLRLRDGDILLLASDGLFNTLSNTQIIAALEGNAQEVCDRLVRNTVGAKKMYQDNVTVLAMRLAPEAPLQKKRSWTEVRQWMRERLS